MPTDNVVSTRERRRLGALALTLIPTGPHAGKTFAETPHEHLHWLLGDADFQTRYGLLYRRLVNYLSLAQEGR